MHATHQISDLTVLRNAKTVFCRMPLDNNWTGLLLDYHNMIVVLSRSATGASMLVEEYRHEKITKKDLPGYMQTILNSCC